MSDNYMSPEGKARQRIDKGLIQAGWIIQNKNQINLSAGLGIAVREYQTDSGPADYILYVKRTGDGSLFLFCLYETLYL